MASRAKRRLADERGSVGKDPPKPGPRQIEKIRRMKAKDGEAAVRKSQRTLRKRLAEHQDALARYRDQGNFTSSVEREINTFEKELEAIDRVLREGQ